MNGWPLLVTFLASLFNTAMLLWWQSSNEKRMDLHWQRLQELQAQIKDLLPLLRHVSRRMEGTELGETEWPER